MKFLLLLLLLGCDERRVTVKLPDGEVQVDTKGVDNHVDVRVSVKSNVVPVITIPQPVPYRAGCLAEKL